MPPDIHRPVTPAGVSPALLLQSYDDSDWEVFVQEWNISYTNKYHLVDRIGGAGDMGRDVIGYFGEPSDPTTQWDNFQCKGYGEPLQTSHIWIELGKLCYFTWTGAYSCPRRYLQVSNTSRLRLGSKLRNSDFQNAFIKLDDLHSLQPIAFNQLR